MCILGQLLWSQYFGVAGHVTIDEVVQGGRIAALQQAAQVSVGEDTSQAALAIHNQGGPGSTRRLAGLHQHIRDGGTRHDQGQGRAGSHDLGHGQELAAEAAGGMESGVVPRTKITLREHGHRERVAQGQHGGSTSRRRELHRTSLGDLPDVQHRIRCPPEGRSGPASDPDDLGPNLVGGREQHIDLVGFAAVGEGQDQVVAPQAAEIPVQRFGWVQKERRCAGAGQGGRDFLPHQTRLAHAGHHNLARTGQDHPHGAREAPVQACLEARYCGRLHTYDFGAGGQEPGVPLLERRSRRYLGRDFAVFLGADVGPTWGPIVRIGFVHRLVADFAGGILGTLARSTTRQCRRSSGVRRIGALERGIETRPKEWSSARRGPLPAGPLGETLPTEQIIHLACLIGILILSLGLHECAHAGVAYLCGDDTAKRMGRLTLNPMAHVDPMMTVIVPGMLFLMGWPLFGGAKPVPVVPSRLRHPARDMMLVAIAGPLTNLLLAVGFMSLWKASQVYWGYGETELLPRVLFGAVQFNILLTLFNMLPIPPLDGSRVLSFFLPDSLRESFLGLERFGLLLVIGLVFFVPPVKEALFSSMDWMRFALYDLTGGNWRAR